MRRVLAILAAAVLSATTLSGQSTSQGGQAGIMVSANNEQNHFILQTTQTEFYLGEPVIDLPAYPVPGGTLRAARFSLRCWKEGDVTRVVVYAVVSDPRTPTKELETAITTHTLKQGDSVRLTETADWGAQPMILRSVRAMR